MPGHAATCHFCLGVKMPVRILQECCNVVEELVEFDLLPLGEPCSHQRKLIHGVIDDIISVINTPKRSNAVQQAKLRACRLLKTFFYVRMNLRIRTFYFAHQNSYRESESLRAALLWNVKEELFDKPILSSHLEAFNFDSFVGKLLANTVPDLLPGLRQAAFELLFWHATQVAFFSRGACWRTLEFQHFFLDGFFAVFFFFGLRFSSFRCISLRCCFPPLAAHRLSKCSLFPHCSAGVPLLCFHMGLCNFTGSLHDVPMVWMIELLLCCSRALCLNVLHCFSIVFDAVHFTGSHDFGAFCTLFEWLCILLCYRMEGLNGS